MRAFHSHYSSAISVALVLIVTLIAAVSADRPPPDADPGFRGIQYAAADDALGQSLDDKRQLVACRQERKKEVALALVRGRRTLLEAGAMFREIDEQNPDFNFELFRKFNPGACDEERHCRQVLGWVCTVTGDESVTDDLLDGYEAELNQLFGRRAVAVADRKTK
jgi:hypothetical protein